MLTFAARICCLLAAFAIASTAGAEDNLVVFETNAPGTDFVVELNPTNDPNLQPLVDNFLMYVTSNLYDGVWINRAQRDFVIQLGGFTTSTLDPASVDGSTLGNVTNLGQVVTDADNNGQVDFPTLSNTRGTISLALSALGPNSGSSSWFVNLTNNAFLDSQGFVPFARIVDMTPIDAINNLDRVDVSTALGSTGSLAFRDAPVFGDPSTLLIVEGATLVPEPTTLGASLLSLVGLASRRRK